MVAMLIHIVPVMISMLFASQHGSIVTVAMLHDVITHTLFCYYYLIDGMIH